MDHDPDRQPAKPPKSSRGQVRDDRLKAALKANMTRRKAQARERAAAGGTVPDDEDNDTKNT